MIKSIESAFGNISSWNRRVSVRAKVSATAFLCSTHLRINRTISANFKINFKCKTKHQKEFLKSIYDHEITIVKGPAGSGKSYVSVYAALDLLKNPDNGYEKIVFIYPVATNPDENIG